MKVLSKMIKVQKNNQSYNIEKRVLDRWIKASDITFSIFYKEDDEHLLKDKWEVITLLIERNLCGKSFVSGNQELVLFTEGKNRLESIYLFFCNSNAPKNEYLEHSLGTFRKKYSSHIDLSIGGVKSINVTKIEFKKNLFGNDNFWFIEESNGCTNNSRITWNRKHGMAVIPIKFNNKNSNGLINLAEVLSYIYIRKNTDKGVKILERYDILGRFGINGYFSVMYLIFETLGFHNLVSGEEHVLQDVEEMPADSKRFFNEMILSSGVFSKSKGINFITLENGDNYLIKLS